MQFHLERLNKNNRFGERQQESFQPVDRLFTTPLKTVEHEATACPFNGFTVRLVQPMTISPSQRYTQGNKMTLVMALLCTQNCRGW